MEKSKVYYILFLIFGTLGLILYLAKIEYWIIPACIGFPRLLLAIIYTSVYLEKNRKIEN